MQTTDDDLEIPVSPDDFTVIDPSTGAAFGAQEREQLTRDIDHPVLWSLSPSDPSGIKGAQADMKTFHALGAHGCSIITGLLSNDSGLSILFPAEHLDLQWNAVIENSPPLALKISGPLSEETIQWLGEKLTLQEVFTVALFDMEKEISEELLNGWRFYLLPYLSVLVLTRNEAAALSGSNVETLEEVEDCAGELLKYGCRSVLIVDTPLSSSGKKPVCDYWSNGTQSAWIRSEGVVGSAQQDGQWDVLCCALTAFHVQAYHELDSLVLARMMSQQSLQQRYPLGEYKEAVWPSASLDRKNLIPELSDALPLKEITSFCAPLRDLSPGWCPVVTKAEQIGPLLEGGFKTCVLHIANDNHPRLAEEIKSAVSQADRYDAQLFIQRHWKQALSNDAFGVLLHAHELVDADLSEIIASGTRLGVIVRSYTDLAAAMYCRPSCIVISPVYSEEKSETPALGYDFFRTVRRLIPVPVFASGGITKETGEDLQSSGADGLLFETSQLTEEEVTARVTIQSVSPESEPL